MPSEINLGQKKTRPSSANDNCLPEEGERRERGKRRRGETGER